MINNMLSFSSSMRRSILVEVPGGGGGLLRQPLFGRFGAAELHNICSRYIWKTPPKVQSTVIFNPIHKYHQKMQTNIPGWMQHWVFPSISKYISIKDCLLWRSSCEILVSFALYPYIRRFAFSVNDGTREEILAGSWCCKRDGGTHP